MAELKDRVRGNIFGIKLCEALGLNPDITRSIKIISDSSGVAKFEAEIYVTEEMTGKIIPLLKTETWEMKNNA